jgi:hypothetical protein
MTRRLAGPRQQQAVLSESEGLAGRDLSTTVWQGDPNSKLNRWLKKTAAAPEPPKPAPPPLPAPASSESKLGRWLKKVEQNPAAPAPGPADAAPGKGEGDVVRRCCAAVRAAWKAADAAAECGGAGAGEWAKLEQEKRALDNLMQMVPPRPAPRRHFARACCGMAACAALLARARIASCEKRRGHGAEQRSPDACPRVARAQQP